MKKEYKQENKQLYTTYNKPYSTKGIINNKPPEFFSNFLSILQKIYNSTLFVYILMGLTSYLMHNIFKNQQSSNINNSNLNLKTKNQNIQILNASVNSSLTNKNNINISYSLIDDCLFTSILYSSIYFSLLILLNSLSGSRKSPLFFSLFYFLITLVTFNFITNWFNFIPFIYDINKIFSQNINIVANIYNIFQYVLLVLNIFMILYFLTFYLNTIGYFKHYIQDLSFERIYHEIALRTDMMKISFNNFIISIKLHKILPGLLYNKKDYYFMNCKFSREFEKISHELYDKDEDMGTKENKNGNNSIDVLNSKSTIDCEYETFK